MFHQVPEINKKRHKNSELRWPNVYLYTLLVSVSLVAFNTWFLLSLVYPHFSLFYLKSQQFISHYYWCHMEFSHRLFWKMIISSLFLFTGFHWVCSQRYLLVNWLLHTRMWVTRKARWIWNWKRWNSWMQRRRLVEVRKNPSFKLRKVETVSRNSIKNAFSIKMQKWLFPAVKWHVYNFSILRHWKHK